MPERLRIQEERVVAAAIRCIAATLVASAIAVFPENFLWFSLRYFIETLMYLIAAWCVWLWARQIAKFATGNSGFRVEITPGAEKAWAKFGFAVTGLYVALRYVVPTAHQLSIGIAARPDPAASSVLGDPTRALDYLLPKLAGYAVLLALLFWGADRPLRWVRATRRFS